MLFSYEEHPVLCYCLQRQTAIMCEAKMFLLLKIVSAGKMCVCWQVSFMLGLTNCMNKQPFYKPQIWKVLGSFLEIGEHILFPSLSHKVYSAHWHTTCLWATNTSIFNLSFQDRLINSVCLFPHQKYIYMYFITVTEYSNCDFISHNCIFISHNFYFISHSYECVFHNCNSISVTAVIVTIF